MLSGEVTGCLGIHLPKELMEKETAFLRTVTQETWRCADGKEKLDALVLQALMQTW